MFIGHLSLSNHDLGMRYFRKRVKKSDARTSKDIDKIHSKLEPADNYILAIYPFSKTDAISIMSM